MSLAIDSDDVKFFKLHHARQDKRIEWAVDQFVDDAQSDPSSANKYHAYRKTLEKFRSSSTTPSRLLKVRDVQARREKLKSSRWLRLSRAIAQLWEYT